MKNNFILGNPGAGKTQLITQMLNHADLTDKVVFIIGRIENPNLKFENLDQAASCTILSEIPRPTDREKVSDKMFYEVSKNQHPEKEILVVIDEAHFPSKSLIEEITGDLKAGKITLWIAAQSFISFAGHWDLNILNSFKSFYLFRSKLNEVFLQKSTIELINILPRGMDNYLHLSLAPDAPYDSIFSDELREVLKTNGDGRLLLMSLRD